MIPCDQVRDMLHISVGSLKKNANPKHHLPGPSSGAVLDLNLSISKDSLHNANLSSQVTYLHTNFLQTLRQDPLNKVIPLFFLLLPFTLLRYIQDLTLTPRQKKKPPSPIHPHHQTDTLVQCSLHSYMYLVSTAIGRDGLSLLALLLQEALEGVEHYMQMDGPTAPVPLGICHIPGNTYNNGFVPIPFQTMIRTTLEHASNLLRWEVVNDVLGMVYKFMMENGYGAVMFAVKDGMNMNIIWDGSYWNWIGPRAKLIERSLISKKRLRLRAESIFASLFKSFDERKDYWDRRISAKYVPCCKEHTKE